MSLMTNLSYIIFWIVVVILTITSTLLSFSLIRLQRQSTDNPKTEQNFRDPTILGIVWILVPVGILGMLLILTFQTI
jgi:heme/copper-type cytochrome/quinol oxidase subunit 2